MALPPAAVDAAHLIDRLDRLARSGECGSDLNSAQWEALRYVTRANRFSRTPAALSDYLGSTRGTVSQTLIALEHKGHVSRQPSVQDRRSIMLSVTPLGERALKNDPINALAAGLAATDPSKLDVLVDALRAALQTLIARNGGREFGACYACRHFRKGGGSSARMPHHCGLLNEPLSEGDSRAICVEQQPHVTAP
ncbi:MAG: MarR family transcriptional regulator [Hyphomicrobium sp.]